uniref:Malectin-like domain-containing protein n=1 Tax=Setaria italica TaxID=4555 RepID=K3ZCY0_SETIT
MQVTMPKRMVAPSWLLLIGLAAAATAGVLQARAQPDSIGFISIDCGLPGTANSVDDDTKLSYAPDAAFTEAGTNHNISVEYIKPTLSKRYLNVRSFPDGTRNCYMLQSLVAGLKYNLRAEFMYGNYDGLNRPPIFDLYAGVNFWSRVNVSTLDVVGRLEVVVVVPDDYVHLRPLKSSLYLQVNATQGLVLLSRRNFGATDDSNIVRYPDDPHDRIWLPFVNTAKWEEISTNNKVRNLDEDKFEVPLLEKAPLPNPL